MDQQQVVLEEMASTINAVTGPMKVSNFTVSLESTKAPEFVDITDRVRAAVAEAGITMGIASILASRRIVLLVQGQHKQDVLRTFMSPEITPSFPASFLWLHSNVTVMCDRAAAGDLE